MLDILSDHKQPPLLIRRGHLVRSLFRSEFGYASNKRAACNCHNKSCKYHRMPRFNRAFNSVLKQDDNDQLGISGPGVNHPLHNRSPAMLQNRQQQRHIFNGRVSRSDKDAETSNDGQKNSGSDSKNPQAPPDKHQTDDEQQNSELNRAASRQIIGHMPAYRLRHRLQRGDKEQQQHRGDKNP